MKRRVLSALLALCLMLSLMPEAWAAGPADPNDIGDGLTWNLGSNGTLIIVGSGNMKNFSDTDPAPWAGDASTISAVVIGNGVKSIGTKAFSDLKLASVTIPLSVTSIGQGAFSNSTVGLVYFEGTQAQWGSIQGAGKGDLSSAEFVFSTPSHTVTYNSNDGKGETYVAAVTAGIPLELPDNAVCGFDPSNANRVLLGWTFGDEDNLVYPAGYLYKFAGDTTANAVWRDKAAEEYTVTDSVTGKTVGKYYRIDGKSQVLNLDIPENRGYRFVDWTYQDRTGDTVTLEAGANGNIAVTSNWTGMIYRIIFNLTGGTGLKEETFTYNEKTQSKRFPAPTRVGYDFDKWTVAPLDAEGDLAQDQNKISISYLPNKTTDLTIGSQFIGDLTLTAQWKQSKYNIEYRLDGGETTATYPNCYYFSEAPQSLKVDGTGNTVLLTDPSKTHYTFKGWECPNKNVTITHYEDPDPTKAGTDVYLPAELTGTLVLTAMWEPETYTVKFENGYPSGYTPDAGDVTVMDDGTATYGEGFELPKPVFTVPDHSAFKAWSIPGGVLDKDGKPVTVTITKDDGTTEEVRKTEFAPGEICFFESNVTVTAIWEKEYTLTFSPGDGGTGNNVIDTIRETDAKDYKLPDNQLSFVEEEKKSFKGWEIDSTEYKPGDSFPISGDTEITALWEDIYTITYKPGKGTGTDVTVLITETDGTTYKLPGIDSEDPKFAFTAPEGKSFAGWIITTAAPDDAGKEVNAGENYEVKSDITVTARWEEKEYKVIYKGGEGSSGTMTDPAVYHFGSTVTLLEPTFTPPVGKVFSHWTVEGYGEAPFQPGAPFKISEEETIVTAVWKDAIYTVTFDPGTGSGTMESKPGFKYGDQYTLPEHSFMPPPPIPPADPDDPDAKEDPYIFVAWDINGTEYAPGVLFEITDDVTATAVWAAESTLKHFTVNYLPGGGSGEMKSRIFYARGDAATVTVALPLQEGCTFEPPAAEMSLAGWIVDGKEYLPGQSLELSNDVEATARWRGKIVYVEGGEGLAPDSYIYSAQGQTLDLPIPIQPGRIFTGWNCDDSTVTISDNNRWAILPAGFKGTLTLTASWDNDKNVYLVTFDPNGGTGTMDPVAVDKPGEDEPAARYELPVCGFEPPAGMEFDCWSVGETKYKVGETITLTGPVTVKAEWKKKDVDPDAKDCVVTYLPGEGTGEAIVEEGHKVGEWLKLPECTFTAPEGKEFDAWDKGAPGEEIYLDSEAMNITALWKDKEPEPEDPNKPWTITFDADGGTGAMSPVTVPKSEGGATYTLPACAFTAPEGKTFQAWKFDGKEYAPGAVITITGDTTITAVWKAAEVKPPKPTSWKITYNLNGGYMTGSGPTSYSLSDQAQTLNVPVPYKSGFTFLGWTYSGVSKPTKSVIIRANMTGDLTVVANWQMNPGAGGSNNTSQGYYISVSATAGGEIIVPWEYASQGATVSVQARPQPGYEVGGVTVVNSQGFEVGDLRDLGGGNYSFTMPGYRVNVSATFKLQSAAAGPITRPVMNFEDVRLGDWYYDSVEYVYNRGMMSGVSATQFGPNGQATRGAIWTALAAHAGFDINGGATWYERGQYWAVNRGITDGESPSGNITREQLVTMLWRYKGSPAVFGGDLWQFSDGFMVSPYAMDAMRWAVSTGLMGGANGRLNPQASTTRAEAATILARFCQS